MKKYSIPLLITGLFVSAFHLTFAAATKPNIVFIFTDDQPIRGLGKMDPWFHTPHTDRLADEGVFFINGFVESSVCAVSRASTLMGQFNSRHGIQSFDDPLSEEQMQQSFPVLLRNAGYRTAMLGKFAVGHPRAAPRELTLPAHHFDLWYGFLQSPSYFQMIEGEKRYMTSVIEEKTFAFMQETPADQPFMVYLCLLEPHGQGGPGSPWNFMDPDFEVPAPEGPPDRPVSMTIEAVRNLPPALRASRNNVIANRPFEEYVTYMETVRKYIARADLTVGRIREELERLGRADNTVIIFASDNGSMWGAHGIAGKWNFYEESIRVPIIVYDPRIPEHKRSGVREHMALNIDLTATILDVAGVSKPEAMQGQSLIPVILNPDTGWRQDWYYLHDVFSRATGAPLPSVEGVRGERFKYAHYLDTDPMEEQLFDLQEDPFEMVNLVDNPDYSEILEVMRQRIAVLREEVK
jgi:arylsulfatase A-like enzyme